MLQRVGEPVSIKVHSNFIQFIHISFRLAAWAGDGQQEQLCEWASVAITSTSIIEPSHAELDFKSASIDCTSSLVVSPQEPVQCSAHAYSTSAEWSHHEEVFRGQASPAQHARSTPEPERRRELYPLPKACRVWWFESFWNMTLCLYRVVITFMESYGKLTKINLFHRSIVLALFC